MSNNWSASRVGCFNECPLKYKYVYVEKWKSSLPVNTEKADKGLCFHESVEKYKTGTTEEQLQNLIKENAKKHSVNIDSPNEANYYDYSKAIKKFIAFWNECVIPKEKEGWIVTQETWVKNIINNQPFVGALDLCLESIEMALSDDKAEELISKGEQITLIKDNVYRIKNKSLAAKLAESGHKDLGKIIIVDYKTASSINANSYKNQQLLYAYLKGLERNWSFEEIANNVKCFIFGPLITDLENKTIEQNMFRGLKEIKYTVDDLENIIKDYYIKTIKTIETMNWARARSNITHACSWCPYCGSKEDKESGFKGCEKTLKAGFTCPENVKFFKET